MNSIWYVDDKITNLTKAKFVIAQLIIKSKVLIKSRLGKFASMCFQSWKKKKIVGI